MPYALRGEFAFDPARLVDTYFDGHGPLSHRYVDNEYLSDLQMHGFSSANKPRGMQSNVNLDAMFRKLVNSCQ